MILERLEEAVRAAREAGAGEAEVSFAGRTLGTSRFANSGLTQAGVIIEEQTRVRVALGARLGAYATARPRKAEAHRAFA